MGYLDVTDDLMLMFSRRRGIGRITDGGL